MQDLVERLRLATTRAEVCTLLNSLRAEPDEFFRYREMLAPLAQRDVAGILRKDNEYAGSWKRRGGTGAFMMLARKWDRLEPQVKRHGFDIFAAALADARPEGILDDIADLRKYLLLVEAEIRVQLHLPIDTTEPESP